MNYISIIMAISDVVSTSYIYVGRELWICVRVTELYGGREWLGL